ncbi:autotransporter outer membrane beta-barrel domain-containing protein [Roseibium litorale]|uniref:Autotransporter outer membrane beta-barrel domain-containing protein n=1 Tax=Roseibium litorale TaxID=2803841 RepID=A0ABR9CJT7_9HYPH|nr:autotransporter outer membrane beta-barrel domain-containing protein [Roseibium litorale]MBD8891003.1 autotransporter outer membrane beta-barrel domain-containing protein [Roseibium litorale]
MLGTAALCLLATPAAAENKWWLTGEAGSDGRIVYTLHSGETVPTGIAESLGNIELTLAGLRFVKLFGAPFPIPYGGPFKVSGAVDLDLAFAEGQVIPTGGRPITLQTDGFTEAESTSKLWSIVAQSAFRKNPFVGSFLAPFSFPGLTGTDSPVYGPLVDIASRGSLTGVSTSPMVLITSFGEDGANGSNGSFFHSGHPGHVGQDGGDLKFTNSGQINSNGTSTATPEGLPASGTVTVASTGGDGGHGGKAGGGAIGGHGGKGARGANGGGVFVINDSAGTIQNKADNEAGILALSIGGEGGAAGGASWASSGNDGGVGGDGGSVNVNNAGKIITSGSNAAGIDAESLGGGGGSGSGGGWFGGSGDGGSGNAGGVVAIGTTGEITTSGASSAGILASSTGGNGGDGGSETGIVAVGGDGGKGGNGGAVYLGVDGILQTSGKNAAGVLAQSVGGGGGRGGNATAIGIVSVSVGGRGGGGGDGGAVSGIVKGDITASGQNSDGLVLQSIGGGGGHGGSAVSVALGPVAVSVAVGGSGGSGGKGGAVTGSVDSGASIITGQQPLIDDTSSGDTLTPSDVTKLAVNQDKGDHSYAVLAQSIGGGGGKGGNVVSVAVSANPDGASAGVAVGVGGNGGSGGNGSSVDFTNAGDLTTYGRHGTAMLLQSIGGGGGAGGASTTVAASVGEVAASVSVGIGGSGGDGGNGGTVTGNNSGSISTWSSQSLGILAQSIGGGGGSGGNVTDVAASLGSTAASVGVGVGGSGGRGADAGSVTITQSGSILTQGAQSHGAVAQSVAGGGGHGGNVHSYSVSAGTGGSSSGGKAFSPSVAVGGSGGAGGTASSVSLTNTGTIVTYGANSFGVVLQSIGGGGGLGGNVSALSVAAALNRSSGSDSYGGTAVSASVAVGGRGGSGGAGGTVSFTADAGSSVMTGGDESSAVVAQSIGGGGGAGGSAQTIAVSTLVPNPTEARNGILNWLTKKFPSVPWDEPGTNNPGTSYSFSAAVGGEGGTGATGGAVNVTLDKSSSIMTSGGHSHGVLSQSIGGGGGNGGAAHSYAIAGYGTYGVSLAIGGSGGSGNHGGTVTVTDNTTNAQTGMIRTVGDHSNGILAQSIGAGGGDGGTSGGSSPSIPGISKKTFSLALGGSAGASGDGGTVSVTREGGIWTSGANSYGIFAQSIGGGGGTAAQGDASKGGGLFAFSLGGTGGSGGNGGSVNIAGSGTVLTTGAQSHGIVAQSVGGGGGAGGASSGGVYGIPVGLSLHLGGGGGSGSNGGTVTVNRGGEITTTGTHAIGILAQSVGGGGGIAGTGELITGTELPVNVHLTDGGNGNGGAVTVSDATADSALVVSTSGTGAHGIFAQSVGGGGGFSIIADQNTDSVNFYEPGSATAGDGGNVTVSLKGTVGTTGAHAYGILAQSAGGGAVVHADDNGMTILSGNGTSGRVNVATADGSLISTSGAGSHGIYAIAANSHGVSAPSSSDSAGLAVEVKGAVTASGAGAAAVRTANGTSPAGTSEDLFSTTIEVDSTSLVSFTGIGGEGYGIYAQDVFDNIYVDIAGSVVTAGDGISDSQAAIKLDGSGTVFVEAGGSVYGAIQGNFGSFTLINSGTVQGSVSGISNYLLNGGLHYLPIDLARGTAATINASTFTLNGEVRPLLSGFGTLSGPKKIIDTDMFNGSLGQVTDSLLTDFQISLDNNDVTLTGVDLDFSRASVSGNDATALSTIKTAVESWTSGAAVAASDTGLHTLALDVANARNQAELDAKLAALDPTQHYQTAENHAAAASAGASAMLSCGMASGSFAAIREGECTWIKGLASNEKSFDTNATSRSAGFAIGHQAALSDTWRLGVSAGFQGTSLDGRTVNSDGERYLAGAVLKYTDGPWLAAASLVGAYSEADATRRIDTSAGTSFATSHQRAASLSTRLRLAYLFEFGSFNVMPLADLDAHWIHDYGYRERGAGSLNLQVKEADHALFDFRPAVRFGRDFKLQDGFTFRPYLEAGARFALNDSNLTSFLPDSLAGLNPRKLTLEREDVSATIGLGLDLLGDNGFEAKLRYDGQFSDSAVGQAVSFKLGYKF